VFGPFCQASALNGSQDGQVTGAEDAKAWHFHLAVQPNQLLTQHGVLSEQFRAAAGEIRQRARDEVGVSRWLDETEELVGGSRQTGSQVLGTTGELVQ